ncbi:hypothetical protein FZC78_19305 [Rossellomorea vietnamensis]|uniref:Gam-like protein n=1 Tax=Rossellomorea vietnamensis TaxID=218284 RepID=A0A5D4NL63_9BACI|nr:host-nuclease inhibitor Gam family protein [Rossellomorea vietnamensis]TYS14301.1 hypothetical protein FZC78_19305 [Rossellomorea vietnamensis]
MNQLQQNELVDEQYIEEVESSPQRFEITDIDSLNWAFRKMSALKAKEKEIQRLADSERDRISSWEHKETAPIKSSLEHFETLIAQYHAKQLQEDPKAKTISTPYGKSKTRKSKETPEKQNEDQLLQHVMESELFEYVKQSLKWGDFKKNLKIVEIAGDKVVVDDTGQIVPGVYVKPESVSYSVEVE